MPALLMDFRRRRIIAAEGGSEARHWIAPPGSTVKPFTLHALLEARKIGSNEQFICPGNLEIAGRSLACSHPHLGLPLRIPTALAYSCNCFVAHFAERFEPGELALRLGHAGFNGRLERTTAVEACRLQAIGEGHVLTTPYELLLSYQRLAALVQAAAMAPVLEGLEGAVEFGTAQLARVAGMRVAGKTGSVITSSGSPLAWFAGFAPARAPEVVVAVAVHGYSGGADAAPIAGRILQKYAAGRR